MSDRLGRDRGNKSHFRCDCARCVGGRTLMRRANEPRSTDELLADDYTYEELMADTCTPESPCHECRVHTTVPDPRTEREQLIEYLDREGIPHNLNDKEQP